MLRRVSMVFLLLVMAAPVAFADEWVGWITDEHCGAKGESPDHGSCALRCHGRGAALVLYNLADKELYKLDNQETAKANVGKKVKITGTKEDGTIKIESVEEVKGEE